MTYPDGTSAKVMAVALAEVGTVEEFDNLTKYGKFMKADGLPWCGSFCNWVMAQSGVKMHSVVSTVKGAQVFKESNRWSQLPTIGALAFIDFPGDNINRISHMGIVIDFKHGSDLVTLVEGNTAPPKGDQRNGGMVMIKQRSLSKDIVGFGVPKYKPYKGELPLIPKAKPKRVRMKTRGKK